MKKSKSTEEQIDSASTAGGTRTSGGLSQEVLLWIMPSLSASNRSLP
jgi:hypothetical protein